MLGREKETRRWLHRGNAWAYAGPLERRRNEAARLRDFERQGDLTIVDHLGEDILAVAELVRSIGPAQILAWVGLDPIGMRSAP